jgi:1-acyl-sn-glycerol-3-phosphate acyltransferase
LRIEKTKKEFQVSETPYVPQTGVRYPEDPDEHMIAPQKLIDLEIGEDYTYLDKSFGFRFKSACIYFGIYTLVFFLAPIRYGLKIEGKEHLRKNRELLKNGAVTVSNHVYRWDFLAVLQAVKYRRLYFPAWKDNLEGADRHLVRQVGGIPIPSNLHGMKNFNKAFDELHEKKKWIHVFPEGSNWHYYQPIRPFKKGAFVFSHRYEIPVIPMAFSYRKPTGIVAFFKKGFPLITLRIGEPIMPDMTLSRRDSIQRLRRECHEKIVALAGITNNPFPAEGD